MKRSITVFIALHFPTALPISRATPEKSLFEKAELIGASTPSLSLHRALTHSSSITSWRHAGVREKSRSFFGHPSYRSTDQTKLV